MIRTEEPVDEEDTQQPGAVTNNRDERTHKRRREIIESGTRNPSATLEPQPSQQMNQLQMQRLSLEHSIVSFFLTAMRANML